MLHENQKSTQTENRKPTRVENAFTEIIRMSKEQNLGLDEQALNHFAQFYQNPILNQSQKREALELLSQNRLSSRSLQILDMVLDEDPEHHLEVLNVLARTTVNQDFPVGESAEETLLGYISLTASLAVDKASQRPQ